MNNKNAKRINFTDENNQSATHNDSGLQVFLASIVKIMCLINRRIIGLVFCVDCYPEKEIKKIPRQYFVGLIKEEPLFKQDKNNVI